MINYYFKYIEFLDTVFLVLKKRPLCKLFIAMRCRQGDIDPYLLAFLHVFHHSSTALLTFVQHEAKISGVTGGSIGGFASLLTCVFDAVMDHHLH